MDETMTGYSRVARLGVLAFGPLLTLMLLRPVVLEGGMGSGGMALAAIFAWSPLFGSFATFLLQHERDTAAEALRASRVSLLRPVLLLPYMVTRSGARAEVLVSVASWLVLVAAFGSAALHTLAGVPSLFAG